MATIAALVTLTARILATALPGQWTQKDLNKFDIKECSRILSAGGEAGKTLKAIMAATNTQSCSGFKLEHGRTQLVGINLSGKGLTDLSPFRLFTFTDGEIDLSHNPISEIRPLIAASHGTYRINLSHTKVKDAALLNASLGGALVLDGNEIDDPGKLARACLASDFSLRGNRSVRGADYDAALEGVYRYYALFQGGKSVSPPTLDLGAMRTVLAPRLTEYITLKDSTVEAIFEDAQRFYRTKLDVYSRIHLDTFEVQKRDGRVTATFALNYGWQDRDLKVPDPDDEAYQRVHRGKRVDAVATVTFDPTFHIVGYIEKTAPKQRRRVVKTTWGVRTLAEVMAVLTEENPSVAKVRIPKGAPLEDAFEYVYWSTDTRSGGEDHFVKVRFNGQVIWARSSAASDERGDLYIEDIP